MCCRISSTIATLLLASGFAGCGSQDSATTATDLSWDFQLQQIHRGESETLRIHFSPVTVRQRENAVRLPGLRVVDLPQAEFGDEGIVMLCALPELRQLRIGSPYVTDQALASLSKVQSLRYLHLINCPVTDRGLAHMHGMTWLESFYLDGGQVTDAGLAALLEALPELHFHRDQLHLPSDPRAGHDDVD